MFQIYFKWQSFLDTYIVRGKPVERFWDFLSPSDHDARTLSSVILTELEKHVKDDKKNLLLKHMMVQQS
jgi:hypothetical protein